MKRYVINKNLTSNVGTLA